MSEDKIGFIGVGNMGGPMALNLVKAGRQLVVHDARADALKPFGNNVQIASSPAEVASEAEIVLASLPRPEIVHGVVALDGPVSGGVAGAVKGTVAVMLAGPKREADIVAPKLAGMGQVFYIGPQPGMGQVMKLINNLLSATAQAATAEAMVMGAKFGLDPTLMIEVLNAGTGRNSATDSKWPNEILPRRFKGGFAMGLMVKDLKLALETAEELHVPMWVHQAVKQLWLYAEGRGGPDQDITELVKHLEAWNGITVAGRKS